MSRKSRNPGTSIQLAPPGANYQAKTDGSGRIVSIEIRGAELPAPDRSMTAEWVRVDEQDGSVRFTFGQLNLDRSGLLAALVVQIPYRRVYDTFYGPNAPFLVSLDAHRAKRKYTVEQPPLGGSGLSTDRVVVERAVIMSTAFLDDEADMRFFRLSASDFHALKLGKAGELVYPVVEVNLGARLLCAVVDQIRVIVDRLGTPTGDEDE